MTDPSPPGSALRRQLDAFDLTAIYLGIILGSGIFVAPAAVAKAAPGQGPGLLLWCLAGAVAACGAFVYAECAVRLPHTGGFYVFYREAYGEPVAVMGGWAAYLLTFPASIALIAIIFANYAATFWSALEGHEVAVAVGVICVCAGMNVVGMRSGPLAQRLLTSLKVVALVVVCLAALVPSDVEMVASPAVEHAPVEWSTWVAALMVLMWTYDGWSAVALVAGEMRDPERDLKRAVLAGTLILMAAYALVHVSVLVSLGSEGAAASEGVFAEAVQARLGPQAGRFVALLVMVSTLGATAGTMLTGARVGYAMAEDGLLPRPLALVHRNWNTPFAATIALAFLSIVFVVTGTFGDLLTVFSFSVWIFYGLVAVALLKFRKRGVGGGDVWQFTAAPWVILMAAAGMTVGVGSQEPKKSGIGLLALLACFPVYWGIQRLRARDSGGGPSNGA